MQRKILLAFLCTTLTGTEHGCVGACDAVNPSRTVTGEYRL